MRPYATVIPALFWAEHIGRQLRTLGRDHQVLAMYLWTAPTSNQYGLFYLPMPQLCEEAGFTLGAANKVLEALGALEFAFYHRAEQWVWVRTLAQYSLMPTGKLLPRTDNRLKGMHSWYQAIPDNPYLGAFFDYYERAFYLPERREWSRYEPGLLEAPEPVAVNQTALVEVPRTPVPAAGPTLFPMVPAGGLVPVARTRGTVARKTSDFDPLFLAWFSHYPAHRQVEKRDAYQEWLKLRPKPDDAWTERAIELLERQKQQRDWIKEGGRYVPRPSKYLEKGKYEDVVREVRYLAEDDVDRITSSIEWASRHDEDDPQH